MKSYNSTKIWAYEIASISENIDNLIEYYKSQLQSKKVDFANSEGNDDYLLSIIEEYEEKIKANDWALQQINAPFKIKK